MFHRLAGSRAAIGSNVYDNDEACVIGASAAAAVGGGSLLLLGDRDVAVAQVARGAGNADPLVVREVRRQLKEGLAQLREGRVAGPRQLAAMLRVYASTIDDDALRSALKRANRRQLLETKANHGELVRQAEELGIDPARLPPHAVYPYADREAVLDRVTKEGLGALMREAADHVDSVGDRLEALPREQRDALVQRIVLQPVPSPQECGECEAIYSGMVTAALVMDTACALAVLFPIPPNIAACSAASAAFLVMMGAWGACQAIVQLCRYYYG